MKIFKPKKRHIMIVCMGFWSILIISAFGWLSVFLVGTLGDTFEDEGLQAAELDMMDTVVELTEKKVERYLGEWEFAEPKIPGHFHHIGRWYQSDNWNFCITCHGPTPHSKTPKERAFLNMHSLFMSCNVCHLNEREKSQTVQFGWMDLEDGKLCDNPRIKKGVWGEYGAKIVTLEPGDSKKILTLKAEEDLAVEFRKKMDQLSDQQKVIGNKLIHRKNVENPIGCSDCHDAKKAFMPFEKLGYSKERAAFLISAEVADLALHYETFYLPNLLNADRKNGNGTENKEK